MGSEACVSNDSSVKCYSPFILGLHVALCEYANVVVYSGVEEQELFYAWNLQGLLYILYLNITLSSPGQYPHTYTQHNTITEPPLSRHISLAVHTNLPSGLVSWVFVKFNPHVRVMIMIFWYTPNKFMASWVA